MFGISTFAQTTFAGLGTTGYVLAISEDFTSADSNAQTSVFLENLTEPVAMFEQQSLPGQFYESIIENFNAADTYCLLYTSPSPRD